MPTWHVLGGGSLGLLCAFHMRQAGFTVNLLLRNSSAVSSFKQSGSCIQLLETWRKNGPQWQRSLPIQASFVPDVSASEPHVIKSHTNCGRLSTPQPYPVRRLVVATKAQDTVPALRNLLPYIEDGCQCILLQNGALAVVDQLQQELGRELGLMPTVSSQQHSHRSSPSSGLSRSESRCFTSSKHVRLYLASVTHGCYREAPLNLTATLPPNANALGVVHAGLGSITVGPLDPLLAIATCLLSTSDRVAALGSNAVASFPVQTEQADPDDASFIREMALALPGLGLRTAANSNSLLQELLAKLAANCTINPLTALLGCRNGALAELPQARAQMREVCRELVTVFGSEMFPLDRQGAANGEGEAQLRRNSSL